MTAVNSFKISPLHSQAPASSRGLFICRIFALDMNEEIINKVAQSGLLTLDLEEYYPREEIVVFDLKPLLFREMILKEKEFRTALLAIDWSGYQDKILAVTCTADAIIPAWAYMLIAVQA